MATCMAFLDRLNRGSAPWVVQRMRNTYGEMPTDPSSFSFWVTLILPIDDHEKAKLLPIRSTRLRLLVVVHWIEQLNNHWYAWLYLNLISMVRGPGLGGVGGVLMWIVLMGAFYFFGW